MLGAKVFSAGMPGLAVQAMCQDAVTSLTATGSDQSGALELTNADNDVTSVAANTGVKLLSTATAGDTMTIFNSGSNPLKVYPDVGAKINGLSTNQAMILATNTGVMFKRVSSTKWFGVLSA